MGIPAIFLGIVYALICVFLALLIGGAGHGWVTPFIYGLSGLVIFPLCFWCARISREASVRWPLLVAFALCMAADVAIFRSTLAEGVSYFGKVAPLGNVWIVLWLAGQLSLAWAVKRHARR